MFIELAEILRCPQDHRESYCVLNPEMMAERQVITGAIGCPICKREYHIADGIADFGDEPKNGETCDVPDPDAVHALLGVSEPGAYVALVGSATQLAGGLAERIADVHCVAVNAPRGVPPASHLSILRSAALIPLRSGVVRGTVLGAEFVADRWLAECARVLIPGARLVVAHEIDNVPGVRRLAVGEGMYVGERE